MGEAQTMAGALQEQMNKTTTASAAITDVQHKMGIDGLGQDGRMRVNREGETAKKKKKSRK